MSGKFDRECAVQKWGRPHMEDIARGYAVKNDESYDILWEGNYIILRFNLDKATHHADVREYRWVVEQWGEEGVRKLALRKGWKGQAPSRPDHKIRIATHGEWVSFTNKKLNASLRKYIAPHEMTVSALLHSMPEWIDMRFGVDASSVTVDVGPERSKDTRSSWRTRINGAVHVLVAGCGIEKHTLDNYFIENNPDYDAKGFTLRHETHWHLAKTEAVPLDKAPGALRARTLIVFAEVRRLLDRARPRLPPELIEIVLGFCGA